MSKIRFAVIVFFLMSSFSIAQNRIIDSLKNNLTLTKEDTLKVGILNELSWEYSDSDPERSMKYATIKKDYHLPIAMKHHFTAIKAIIRKR